MKPTDLPLGRCSICDSWGPLALGGAEDDICLDCNAPTDLNHFETEDLGVLENIR